jgi:phosphopentomutase
VSRVIARPFTGGPGAWRRSAGRRDWSVPPPGPTLLDRLAEAGVPRVGVGKVDDLFAGRAITSRHTATNDAAYTLIEEALASMEAGFLLANVVEFDQSWGHRNDVAGFHGGLQALDARVDRLLAPVRPGDLVIITADHGNDPTTPSTDHTREEVPLLVVGPDVRPVPLGCRATFADAGQTIAEWLGAAPLEAGRSFLHEVLR